MGKMLDDLKKKLEDPEVIERMKKRYKDIQDKKERDIKRLSLIHISEPTRPY